MKKTVFVIGLLLAVVCGVFAQVSVAGKTYYYKYVETVNTVTGVKTNRNNNAIYITFTSNGCYESNEKGIQTGKTYSYQGEQNSRYAFLNRNIEYGYDFSLNPYGVGGHMVLNNKNKIIGDHQYFLYFAKDYKRINKRTFHGRTEDAYNKGPYDTYGRNLIQAKDAYWEEMIDVYEQTEPAKPDDGPVEFY